MSTNLDYSQVIQNVYDETENRLRVDADITAVIPGGIQVNINSVDDSIAIADSTGNPLKINSDGSINVNSATTISGTIDTVEQGLSAFQTSQYIIGTSAVQITPSPLSNRSSVSLAIIASPNIPIYIGNSNSVTINSGYPLYNGNTIELDLTPSGSIWAISTTTGQIVAVLEMA